MNGPPSAPTARNLPRRALGRLARLARAALAPGAWRGLPALLLDLRVTRGSWLAKLKYHYDQYNANRPVLQYLTVARRALAAVDTLRADVYVAHGVQALPAVSVLAHRLGVDYLCDVIEIPSFAARALPSRWHPTNLELLDCAFETYLRRARGLLTVGDALGAELRALNPAVHVLPNYRHATPPGTSTLLRERCALAPGDRLLVSISTHTTGLEQVIEALARLPEDVHLAVVGRFVPAQYRDTCLALAARLGVGARVHCFSPVPYDELTTLLSSADAGLVVLDAAIPNHRVALPNRIFDYVAAGVPVCTPAIADIAALVRQWDMGAVAPDTTPEAWASTLLPLLARAGEVRHNARRAAAALVWEALEDRLYEALGRPRRVCYVGVSHLLDNNRTLRMARSLARRGVEVILASPRARGASATRAAALDTGIRHVTLEL